MSNMYAGSSANRMGDVFDSSDSPPPRPFDPEDVEPYTPTMPHVPITIPHTPTIDITEVVDERSPIQPGAKPQTPEPYSPRHASIKIVKRKHPPQYDPTKIKRVPKESKDKEEFKDDDTPSKSTSYLLSLTPSKSCLRQQPHSDKRARRSVTFPDAKGDPLVHIKEIPSLQSNAHHCSNEDLRSFEAKEERFVSKLAADMVEWRMIELDAPDKKRIVCIAKSPQIEERRLKELGLYGTPLFSLSKDLETIDQPHLASEARLAARDRIPHIPLTRRAPPEETGSNTIRQLPMPGYQQSDNYHDQTRQPNSSPVIRQVFETDSHGPRHHHHQQQQQRHQYGQIFDDTPGKQSSSSSSGNYYQQEPYHATGNDYYSTSSFKSSEPVRQQQQQQREPVKKPEPPRPAKAISPKTATEVVSALPASLRAMLDQLKTKGYVSTGDTPPHQSDYDYEDDRYYDQQQPPQYGQEYDPQHMQQGDGGGYQASFSGPPAQGADEPAYPIQQSAAPGEKWVQCGWKIPEPCTYFVYRVGGCVRGDQCRFIHDEEMKQRLLREKAEKNPDHDRGHYYRGIDDRGGPFRADRGDRRGRGGPGPHGNGPRGPGGPSRNGGSGGGGGDQDRGGYNNGRYNGPRRDFERYDDRDRRQGGDRSDLSGREHRLNHQRERTQYGRFRDRREKRDERAQAQQQQQNQQQQQANGSPQV